MPCRVVKGQAYESSSGPASRWCAAVALAHFCTGSNTMVTYLLDLASISRSWLAGVSAEQWRTISKGVTIIMIIFLVVAEGIIAWRDGASFPRIAAAVMLVLVKESMWYDVSYG